MKIDSTDNSDIKSTVMIGRFQPFHQGHLDLINEALINVNHLFIVIGSAKSPRQLRNPFTAKERIDMITQNLNSEVIDRVHFVEARDYFYNNSDWINEVTNDVRRLQQHLKISLVQTSIIGFENDKTSKYLSWFPHWDKLEFKLTKKIYGIVLREAFLRNSKSITNFEELSFITKKWLKVFSDTDFYKNLQEEQIMIDGYKKSWSQAPYPPVFVTTDIVLICKDHVLLIQRKNNPGKNQWANPGGFLDGEELILDCALRELAEETAIDISEAELREALCEVQVFDHPLRSSRGRTITHAHLFKLKSSDLPSIKASDDAIQAKWVPILDLGKMENDIFEDHFHIINVMINK